MRRIAGFCRFVYNKALALQKARDEQGEKKRVQHPGSRDENLVREGRDTPGWPVDRTTRVVGSRNPPKRRRGGSMPRLSAVGISGLQAGEDVKGTSGDAVRPLSVPCSSGKMRSLPNLCARSVSDGSGPWGRTGARGCSADPRDANPIPGGAPPVVARSSGRRKAIQKSVASPALVAA